MCHLFKFQVLDKLSPRQEEVRSKLFYLAWFSYLDLILAKRLFLPILTIQLRAELIMEVWAKIVDERVEVVEFWLIFGIIKLVFIDFHQRVKLCNLWQKIWDLLLVPLELAKLLIKIENNPNGFFIEFVSVFILSIFGNHWNIIELFPDQTQHFKDSNLCIFLSQQPRIFESSFLVSTVRTLHSWIWCQSVEYPFSFFM